MRNGILAANFILLSIILLCLATFCSCKGETYFPMREIKHFKEHQGMGHGSICLHCPHEVHCTRPDTLFWNLGHDKLGATAMAAAVAEVVSMDILCFNTCSHDDQAAAAANSNTALQFWTPGFIGYFRL